MNNANEFLLDLYMNNTNKFLLNLCMKIYICFDKNNSKIGIKYFRITIFIIKTISTAVVQ